MTLRDHRLAAAEASWSRALLTPAAGSDPPKQRWIAERRGRLTRARRRMTAGKPAGGYGNLQGKD